MFLPLEILLAKWRCKQLMRALLERPSLLGPIPAAIWEHPYFLGFLSDVLIREITFVTNGKLRAAEWLALDYLIAAETLSKFSGLTEKQIIERKGQFCSEDNAEFIRGLRNAGIYMRAEYPRQGELKRTTEEKVKILYSVWNHEIRRLKMPKLEPIEID